VLIKEIFDKS
jgi:hypothetical protein